MKGEDRKVAVSDYKKRKVEAGIYTVRCTCSGQIWVGSAPDLATIQNRLWFTLRQGRNPHYSLQNAWNIHGIETFAFEVVERLDDEESGYIRDRMLRDLRMTWTDKLQAVPI